MRMSEDGTVVIRTARKPHTCVQCGVEIEPGETYVEYLGETPAFQSGSRYCAFCAVDQGHINDPADAR